MVQAVLCWTMLKSLKVNQKSDVVHPVNWKIATGCAETIEAADPVNMILIYCVECTGSHWNLNSQKQDGIITTANWNKQNVES